MDRVEQLLQQVPSIGVRAELRDIITELVEKRDQYHGQVLTAAWMVRRLKAQLREATTVQRCKACGEVKALVKLTTNQEMGTENIRRASVVIQWSGGKYRERQILSALQHATQACFQDSDLLMCWECGHTERDKPITKKEENAVIDAYYRQRIEKLENELARLKAYLAQEHPE